MVALARRLARIPLRCGATRPTIARRAIRPRRPAPNEAGHESRDQSRPCGSVREVIKLEEQARVRLWPHVRAVPQRALLLLRIVSCAGTDVPRERV